MTTVSIPIDSLAPNGSLTITCPDLRASDKMVMRQISFDYPGKEETIRAPFEMKLVSTTNSIVPIESYSSSLLAHLKHQIILRNLFEIDNTSSTNLAIVLKSTISCPIVSLVVKLTYDKMDDETGGYPLFSSSFVFYKEAEKEKFFAELYKELKKTIVTRLIINVILPLNSPYPVADLINFKDPYRFETKESYNCLLESTRSLDRTSEFVMTSDRLLTTFPNLSDLTRARLTFLTKDQTIIQVQPESMEVTLLGYKQ